MAEKNNFGFTNITSAIEDNAKQEATQIVQLAEQQHAELLATAIATAEADAVKIIDNAKREAGNTYRSRVDSAIKANASLKENQERELLDLVDSSVMQYLLDLPAQEYLNLVVSAICNNAQDGDVIIAGEDDLRVTDKLVSAVGKRFGKKISLSAERGTFSGGIIIKGARKGKPVILDFSFESIVASTKVSEKDKILKILFN